jgi:methyl-accepting chemotaxis protein
MLSHLKIPRKLGLSFVAICATAAVVMAVFAVNLFMMNRLSARSDASRNILAQTMALETSILRENSQLRGFLVTGDPSYLKSYGEARAEFDKTAADLRGALADPREVQLLDEAREGTIAWREAWSDPLVSQIKAGQQAEAQERVRAAGKAVLVTKPVLALREIRDNQKRQIEENDRSQAQAILIASVTLAVGGVAMIGLAVVLALALSRSIAQPITELTATMTDLASGKLDISLPEDRQDELGDMAAAVKVFRDTARAREQAERDQKDALAEIGLILRRLADADLTVRLQGLPSAYQTIASDFNEALARLSTAMQTVGACVDTIRGNSAEIRAAASELSDRSENQASNLARQASAMEEITSLARNGAALINEANGAMAQTRDEAEHGGRVVQDAIGAMNGIDRATHEISEIIGLIDGIAFQTNLLALNAGVEAARAGDAGKGFAVVASEVRALAQRSADAARDVKTRILSAGEHVQSGVKLVNETGEALHRIIDRVGNVSETINAIATSAQEQSQGLEQINGAISQMDGMTQKNAAMVEETTAAAHMMSNEAGRLFEAFSAFKVSNDGGAGMASAPFQAAPARPRASVTALPAARPAPAPVASAPAPHAVANGGFSDNDWTEF